MNSEQEGGGKGERRTEGRREEKQKVKRGSHRREFIPQ